MVLIFHIQFFKLLFKCFNINQYYLLKELKDYKFIFKIRYECVRIRTCRDNNPCFPGVECQDTSNGPSCGACPRGYEGNGEQCVRRSGCEYSPCHPGKYITGMLIH